MSSNKNNQNSSKTAHVMNLLSRGGRGAAARQAQAQPIPAGVPTPASALTPAQETVSESTSFSAAATEVATQAASPTATSAMQAPPVPQVPPIISIMNADAEASATIKDALEDALENALLQDPSLLDPFEPSSTTEVHTALGPEEIGFAPIVGTEPIKEPVPSATQATPAPATLGIPISTPESVAEPSVSSPVVNIPICVEKPAAIVESASVTEDTVSLPTPQTTPKDIKEPEILPAVSEVTTPSQIQPSIPSTPASESSGPKNSTITEVPVSEKASPVVSVDENPMKSTDSTKSTASDDESIDFTSVNVMEFVVESKVDKYIDLFGLCHCPRCRADVIALALNRLPAKYIVTPKNEALPRISMYESNLGTVATAEILWACKAVFDAPRHKKES